MTSTEGASTWLHSEQYNALGPIDQDFSHLGHLDVSFDFDFLNNFDSPNSADASGKLPAAGPAASNPFATSAQQQHAVQPTHGSSAPLPMAQGSPMFDMAMHFNFDAHSGQSYNLHAHNPIEHSQMIPQTPNSVEMHANTALYMQQMDAQSRAMMEHYQMSTRDAMNQFTPLGTPAVTPHDFVHNDYTNQGGYFSPLTSPLLDGQHNNGQHTSASSVATSSPTDQDVDMVGDVAPAAKKPNKKRMSISRPNGGRKVAQSPIQKPMQRKKTAVSAIQSREMNELLESTSISRHSPTSPRNSRMNHSYASSDSISPEPLSEVMGPPPKPASAKPSPAIIGQSPTFTAKGYGSSPATPASLMRLQPSGEVAGSIKVPSPIHETATDVPMLEELALPEAVISAPKRPNISRIDTATANGDLTPQMGAGKGTKTGMNTPSVPSSGPSAARSMSISSALCSPTNGLTGSSTAKQSSKSRITKKRGSMSGNVQLSPAIRPRISISPNIQPLVPGGGPGTLTDQERTTFLASRSNYQNLIEGTNIPGVSYPSDLPTQLTSKRTSHKIAEQGRRQRINIALQKMQTLLPKTLPGEKNGANEEEDDDDEDEDGSGGKRKGSGAGKGGGNSKAATVESAIVYIEKLQLEKRTWEELMAARERKWAEEQEAERKQQAELMQMVRELQKKLVKSSDVERRTATGAAGKD